MTHHNCGRCETFHSNEVGSCPADQPVTFRLATERAEAAESALQESQTALLEAQRERDDARRDHTKALTEEIHDWWRATGCETTGDYEVKLAASEAREKTLAKCLRELVEDVEGEKTIPRFVMNSLNRARAALSEKPASAKPQCCVGSEANRARNEKAAEAPRCPLKKGEPGHAHDCEHNPAGRNRGES